MGFDLKFGFGMYIYVKRKKNLGFLMKRGFAINKEMRQKNDRF